MTQLSGEAAQTDFDRTTTLTPVPQRAGEFTVDLDPGWSSLVGVHGGYMCALAVRGAETVVPGRTVRTINASFLKSGRVGPATLSVTALRSGRTMSTVTAELIQNDQVLVVSRLTLMNSEPGVEWSDPQPTLLPPPATCVPFPAPPEVVSFGRFELLFDPSQMPFTAEQASLEGYVRPLEPRPIDTAWLVMAADCFPPPAFARAPRPVGGISIDLTVHIHRSDFPLGEDDWLVGSFEIRDSAGGLAVEHGRITHPNGTLVAESFHSRLTATR
jgi:acyl-CoA thioesterase